MRAAVLPATMGAAVSASAVAPNPLSPRDTAVSFTLEAYGPSSAHGPIGQLGNGANRIGDGLPRGEYTLQNGRILDKYGRGCILTPPTTVFQCDPGVPGTAGFAITSDGTLTINGTPVFWACPVNDYGVWDLHSKAEFGQPKCVQITLKADTESSFGIQSFPFDEPEPAPEPSPTKRPCPHRSDKSKCHKCKHKPNPCAHKPGQGKCHKAKPTHKPCPPKSGSGKCHKSKPKKPCPSTLMPRPSRLPVSRRPEVSISPSLYSSPSATSFASSTPQALVSSFSRLSSSGVSSSLAPEAVFSDQASFAAARTAESPLSSSATAALSASTEITPSLSSSSVSSPSIESPLFPSPALSDLIPFPTSESSHSTSLVPTPSNSVPYIPAPSSSSESLVASSPVQASSPSPENSFSPSSSPSPTPVSSCPADLKGTYAYPESIIPVDISRPHEAFGNSPSGTFTPSICSIFNFNISAQFKDRTCSTVFLFPKQEDLRTSSFTYSADSPNGRTPLLTLYKLSTPADETTKWDSIREFTKKGDGALVPGQDIRFFSESCAAGQKVSYLVCARYGSLSYVQDDDSSPIGVYIPSC